VTAAGRFAIRRDIWLRPLLFPFGGTAGRSYVEVGPRVLHVRFGWLFDRTFALDEIATVRRGNWPWWGGLGWRSNLIGRIGLVASYGGIVDIELKRKRRIWLAFLPLPCNRLTISLEEPDAFVSKVAPRLHQPDLVPD
jgi:hypothetical protein